MLMAAPMRRWPEPGMRSEPMVEITLDWDTPYEKALYTFSHVRLLRFLKDNGIKSYRVRRSSGGNTHISFEMPGASALDVFSIRAMLNDDRTRLIIDLVRAYKKMDVNRLFDRKCVKGKIRISGTWRVVTL